MSPELLEGAISFKKETFLSKIVMFCVTKLLILALLLFALLLGIDVYACALVLWEVISRGDFYGKTHMFRYFI